MRSVMPVGPEPDEDGYYISTHDEDGALHVSGYFVFVDDRERTSLVLKSWPGTLRMHGFTAHLDLAR